MTDLATTDIKLRKPCQVCECEVGSIRTNNGQDVVRCYQCGCYQYNAPRLETGRAQRTLSTRPGITPSQRARIYAFHDYACIGCGVRAPVELTLQHIISRKMAAQYGLLDEVIDSLWNLAPMCAECNSGDSWVQEAPIRLLYRCLLIKLKQMAA